MDANSIVICGVGGQGIILASDILSYALFKSGMDVKKNEIHGMSQREGSVVSFIRYGEKVYSPVVSNNEADYLLSFEKLEALRNIHYLKEGGCAVINDLEISPAPVSLGITKYPKDVESRFLQITKSVKIVNALELAKKLGNPRVGNVLLLGVLSKSIDSIKTDAWLESIRIFVQEKYLEINMKAFEAGRGL